MAAIIDAIGLVGTLLTTIGFAQSNLPDSAPNGAVLRVKVGLDEFSGEQKVSELLET